VGANDLKEGLGCTVGDRPGTATQIVFQELQITPVHGVDVPRRAEFVPQPKLAGVLLSGRAVPAAIAGLLEPRRAPGTQAEEIVLSLAFDPASGVAA